MIRKHPGLLFGAAVAAFFLVRLVAFTVRSTEVAVVTRFGKPARTIKRAGLHWKWPSPVETVYRYDARIQSFEGKFEETYTQDGRNLIVMVYSGWRIDDPIIFLERVGSLDDAKRNLEGLIATFKNGVIGKHPFSHLVSLDQSELHFEQIEQEMLDAIQQEARQRYGIAVEFVGIKMLGLPQTITQKVFARMSKERERVATAYRAEGDLEAARIRADADLKRDQILADADAQAKQISGQADAEAAKHYKVFETNPELANFLRELEAMEATMKDRTTAVFDTRSAPWRLLQSPGGGGGR